MVGESEAEDLTQIALQRVSEGLPRFRGEASLSTWIYRIATNAALDKLRSAKHEPADRLDRRGGQADDESDFEEGVVSGEAQSPSAEVTLIRAEMNTCIREFIERLPENYRTVLVLSELEGFGNGEIASVLGVRLDTVKIRLHRAREKLRNDLASGCSFYRDERSAFACDRVGVTNSPPVRPGEQ